MASKMLGRVPCVEPTCGFQSAHIKVNTDTEGKRPYRHCPECGAQYFPRNQAQVDRMIHSMRPDGDPVPAKTQTTQTDAPPEKVDPPVAGFKYVFGVKVAT